MPILEIELRDHTVGQLVERFLSQTGTPVPTIASLGSQRLIHSIVWTEIALSEAPVGILPLVGGLAARSRVTVEHYSVDELRARPSGLPKSTVGTAWLDIQAKGARIEVRLVGFDLLGQINPVVPAITMVGESLSSSSPDARSLLLYRDGIVTLRMVAAHEVDGGRPPANQLAATGGDWLIWVPADALVGELERQITASVRDARLGAIEEPASTEWVHHDDGTWGAVGVVGILSESGCGISKFSVDLEYSASFVPSLEPAELVTTVAMEANVSDWDTLKCMAFVGGAWAGFLGPLLPGAFEVMLVIPPTVAAAASGSLLDATPGGSVERVTDPEDPDKLAFRSRSQLPALPTRTVDAVVDERGLVVSGTTLAPRFPTKRICLPDARLSVEWSSRMDCASRSIRSEAIVEPVFVEHLIGDDVRDREGRLITRAPRIRVKVFSTTLIDPPQQWLLRHANVLGERARFDIVSREGQLPSAGFAVLHTSAGVFARSLAPPGDVPALGEPVIRGMIEQCRRLRRQWAPFMDLLWRPDPPPFWREGGRRLLRHWSLIVEHEEYSSFHVAMISQGKVVEQLRFEASPDVQKGILTLVTDDSVSLQLQTKLREPPSLRVLQRYLVESDRAVVDTERGGIGRGSKANSALGSRRGRVARSFGAFHTTSAPVLVHYQGEERLCWAGPALLDSTDCGFEAEIS